MQVDALAVRLRPRSPMEAADLGVRLCQHALPSVYRCLLPVVIPCAVIVLATYSIADWLPSLLLFWLKPWFDRTILFVLARAAFGQSTRFADVWAAQRVVWWRGLWRTLTLQRLSPWRALTQPVYQLEGLPYTAARRRIVQIRRRTWGSATLTMFAFSMADIGIQLAFTSLLFWLAPVNLAPAVSELFNGTLPLELQLLIEPSYVLSLCLIEPFFVGAGFALYLNRRTELEAWDIEQEFKRAFAA